ncbi:hypothetical protein EOM82_04795 [bacterium]|nr:hypothetical protein [bacterium]
MRKVYISSDKEKVEVGIVIDGRIEQFYRLDRNLLTGTVILGKVDNIRKAVGVFVNIGMDKNGLLPYRENLKSGDMVCVQVVKEAEGDKGCALTEKITLAGRFAVLNDLGEIKFSPKIDENRKLELLSLYTPDSNIGFIFRSSCMDADNDKIIEDMLMLKNRYNDILARTRNNYKVGFLYTESSEEVAERFAYSQEEIVYGFDDIIEQIETLGERKVEVDGVELVFDKTEAMMVIDVNSRRYNRQFVDAEKTNFEANMVAVKEIARQIRLRNIGGIIMVDFISLKDAENKITLLKTLKEELKKDNVKVKAELIESLSLFAITRKQRYNSL